MTPIRQLTDRALLIELLSRNCVKRTYWVANIELQFNYAKSYEKFKASKQKAKMQLRFGLSSLG
jgi:hypothetical protein